MKKVMSERMQQLLRDPEATRRLRIILQTSSAIERHQSEKITFIDQEGHQVVVSPRFVNVG